MSAVAVISPAKLNLFLAVTGRRADGYHDLVSLVAPLDWGDRLEASPAADFTLECSDPAVPVDGTNLVLRAARLFRERTGWTGGAHFVLQKRIPMGAGLGGGSSNGGAALRLLNQLAGEPLDAGELMQLAADVGSDCPLFLAGGPCLMRGRGDRVEVLPSATADRLRGRAVLLFKPSFGVATGPAYARLARAAPGSYLPEAEAEARLSAWLDQPDRLLEDLLFNSFEPAIFSKFVALPALLAELRERHGVQAAMSGSGSACFVLPSEARAGEALTAAIREAWGPAALVVATRLA